MNKKEKIDEVLKHNAELFQNLGTDSTAAERNAAKRQEILNLKAIKALDPEKINRLLVDTDK
jgi:hypothetical protein